MVYEVKVTVSRPEVRPKNIIIPTGITFLIRTDSEINAKVEALNRARQTQAAHPRKYKSCTFSVGKEDIKIF